MPAAPPTARSTTHRTIPQARSFERGSANRMRLIGTSARLCAQALCAGPSLHDRASDKSGAHTTAQTIQKTSQEKEEKGKEEKKVSQHCDGHYAGSQMQGPITARREGSCSHNAHTKHIAAPDERPCPLRRRVKQTARTGSSNNARSSQIAARPSTPFSAFFLMLMKERGGENSVMGALSQLPRTHNGIAAFLLPMSTVNHMPAAHYHRQRRIKKPHGRPFKTRSYNAAGKTAQTRRAVDTVSGSGMAAHPCRPLHKDKKRHPDTAPHAFLWANRRILFYGVFKCLAGFESGRFGRRNFDLLFGLRI